MSLPFGSLFAPAREQNNLVVDFIDVATQTGFVEYQGIETRDDSGVERKMLKFDLGTTIGTNEIKVAQALSDKTGSMSKIEEITFDVGEFNRTALLRGTGFLRCAVYTNFNSGTMDIKVRIRLRRSDYAGGGETVSVYSQTETVSTTGGAYFVFRVPFDIPQTVIPAGVGIRIIMESWAVASADTTTQVQIMFDPATTDHELLVVLPYRLDN